MRAIRKETRIHIRASRRCPRKRSGTALLLAMFVAAVASTIVVAILDTQTLQYSALRNTIDFDRSRYLAEAGLSHAISILEGDFYIDDLTGFDVATTEFPAGSGSQYFASVSAVQADGTRIVTAVGTAAGFTRRLEIRVKMGG